MSPIIKTFNYNDSKISFELNGQVMVNATEMAKAFKEKPEHYLRNQKTKDFIAALSASQNWEPTDLVIVINGGLKFGTWMHEDVALDFAQWLSPKFKVWCIQRIKELLTTGSTSITSYEMPKTFPESLRQLADKIEENHLMQLQLEEATPKVKSFDYYISSTGLMSMEEVAKSLGTGRNRLFAFLREKHILNSGNIPFQQFIERDYFQVKQKTYVRGCLHPYTQTYVTPKGLEFISTQLRESKQCLMD